MTVSPILLSQSPPPGSTNPTGSSVQLVGRTPMGRSIFVKIDGDGSARVGVFDKRRGETVWSPEKFLSLEAAKNYAFVASASLDALIQDPNGSVGSNGSVAQNNPGNVPRNIDLSKTGGGSTPVKPANNGGGSNGSAGITKELKSKLIALGFIEPDGRPTTGDVKLTTNRNGETVIQVSRLYEMYHWDIVVQKDGRILVIGGSGRNPTTGELNGEIPLKEYPLGTRIELSKSRGGGLEVLFGKDRLGGLMEQPPPGKDVKIKKVGGRWNVTVGVQESVLGTGAWVSEHGDQTNYYEVRQRWVTRTYPFDTLERAKLFARTGVPTDGPITTAPGTRDGVIGEIVTAVGRVAVQDEGNTWTPLGVRPYYGPYYPASWNGGQVRLLENSTDPGAHPRALEVKVDGKYVKVVFDVKGGIAIQEQGAEIGRFAAGTTIDVKKDPKTGEVQFLFNGQSLVDLVRKKRG